MLRESPTSGGLDPCVPSSSRVHVTSLASQLFLKPVFSRTFPLGLLKSLGRPGKRQTRCHLSLERLGGWEGPPRGSFLSLSLVTLKELVTWHLPLKPEDPAQRRSQVSLFGREKRVACLGSHRPSCRFWSQNPGLLHTPSSLPATSGHSLSPHQETTDSTAPPHPIPSWPYRAPAGEPELPGPRNASVSGPRGPALLLLWPHSVVQLWPPPN